jgi:arylsulfatase A-like enzyme/multidrug efflux pump subunit AcrA (membrane-fusion protein)
MWPPSIGTVRVMRLVFCSLDTLRADRLGCIGSNRGLTPNLDRIASEGALFTQCYASDIPTQPSHTAIFTGQFGVRTGIVSHFHPAAYLEEDTLWMPSLLRRHGYVTGAVDHLFAMKDWFIRGYDDYMPPPGRSRSPGSVINGMGFPWLDAHAAEQFYLFLHFWDAHIPYLPPSPFKERFSYGTAGRIDPDITDKLQGRPSYPLFKQNLYDFLEAMPNLDYIADLYDAEVAYLDHEIGRLFCHLGELDLLDDTLVVLFGDHGENMTEHDSWFDHAGLYDSVTHVPLILWAPGRIPAFETSEMVALIDVLPTVLEVLDLPEADGLDGRSLMPLIRGEVSSHREAVMLSEATWNAARGIRTPEWKFIRYLQTTIYGRDGVELYHLADDPHEQHNVADAHPEVVDRMHAQLQHWVGAQLGGRPDPMLSVIDAGLPAVARLNQVVAGLARPRHDLPAAAVAPTPGMALVPVGPVEDENDDAGQQFAPGHNGRLRGTRGVLAAAILIVAAALLGLAVNDVLLADPLSASGVVQPASAAQLNMATTGPIAAIPVHVGQMVKSGQVLATQDTSAVQAKLSADEAKLTSDQATLAQEQAGVSPAKLQQLQAAVSSAQVQLTSAQQKLATTTTTSDTDVSAAAAQVTSDQQLLAADQQAYSDDLPACVSAEPPSSCATDQRQVQVDQGNLSSAESAEQQAEAQQAADLTAARAQVSQAAAAVTSAQAALTAGDQPATPQQISTTQAQIQQDQASIVTDKSDLSKAVLVAPFSGVVASVGGTVGELATNQGVRQATSPQSVSQAQSTGIQIFPQGPQTNSDPSPTFAALVSLDSTQTQLVVQVPQADISQVHVGERTRATLPAVVGSRLTASVSAIQPTPVVQSGQTYFLVHLLTNSKTLDAAVRSDKADSHSSTPPVGFTVDVSF